MNTVKKVKLDEAYAKVEWCKETFGKQVYGGRWWRNKGHLYFRETKDYLWFTMRFGNGKR